MLPSQFLDYPDRQFAPQATVSEDIPGGMLRRFIFDLQPTVPMPGSGVDVPVCGAANLIRELHFLRNGTSVGQMQGEDAWHLARLIGRGTSDSAQPTTTSTTVNPHEVIDLDWGRLMPGAAFDASGGNVVGYRVAFGADTDYHNGAASGAIAGNLQVQAEHNGGVVAQNGYLQPSPSYDVLQTPNASTQYSLRKKFDGAGQLLGVMFKAKSGTGATSLVDGLVKNVKIFHTPASAGQRSLLAEAQWAQIKILSRALFQLPEATEEPGLVFYPFRVSTNRRFNGALPIAANDVIEINLDTAGTAPGHISNVSPSSGDEVTAHWIFFEPMGPPAARTAGVAGRPGRTRRGRRSALAPGR